MSAPSTPSAGIPVRRRVAAAVALAAFTGAVVSAVVLLWHSGGWVLVAIIAIAIGGAAAFTGLTSRGWMSVTGWLLAVASLVILGILAVTGPTDVRDLLAITLLLGVGIGATRIALRLDDPSLRRATPVGSAVDAAQRGALILNPWSGGGAVERFNLIEEAQRRGIETIVLQRGDDLRSLAEKAIENGADVVGMAGGDGSQALVAAVAVERDTPFVCIPAGTRNHFALDLGLDRKDVVGALDAYTNAVERHVDLARVGDRVFVNNVSLGIYAKIVQSDDYRDNKVQVTLDRLPDLAAEDVEPFDLRFTGPDGEAYDAAHLILVSNNPYQLTRVGGRATREQMDSGLLGIVAMRIRGAPQAAELAALQVIGQTHRFSGLLQWAAPDFAVHSTSTIEAGVDGEALLLEPPLEFAIMPGALRIRRPRHAPGYSPAAVAAETRPSINNVKRLARILVSGGLAP
jgi:diacylglycerol kinase family enzyme